MWKIYGKYGGRGAEVVDECYSEQEANYLINEYRMAFGVGWTLWVSQ